MRRRIPGLLVGAALLIGSCGSNALEPDELASTDALVRALQQQGLSAKRAETMARSAFPFFSVAARRVVVNDVDIQVFEYSSASRADQDAARVSPTGTPIGQSQISWMDTPHFYKRDRLIVLYVGHSAEILGPLEATLGSPFAAGR